MEKHAYLILAHHDFQMLGILLSCLDDERNDIFLHIDAKVRDIPVLTCKKSQLHILKDRVRVNWGGYSMIEAELRLMEAAHRHGPYLYYHLLSGVDLPLRSQDFIHHFFKVNEGKEFIGYTNIQSSPEIELRMKRWHLFPERFRDNDRLERALHDASIKFQTRFGIFRNRDVDFMKGPQWVSVTGRMVSLLLFRKKEIRHVFKHTKIPDECLFQTFCWNSTYRENIYHPFEGDDVRGSLRLVGWRADGTLRDWSSEDYEFLCKNKTALFARKFNSKDLSFINRILEAFECFRPFSLDNSE